MKDLNAKAQELGTIGDALKWARDNGYSVDTDTELPPLAVQPNEGGMDETDNTETEDSVGALGALDPSNVDFSKMSDPNVFNKIYSQQFAQQQAAERSMADAYKAAEERLKAKYAGPSQAEQLFALSRAMLSPRKVPGFKGFLGNVMGTFGDIESAQRKAEQDRAEQLAQLQMEQMKAQAQMRAGQSKSLTDLMRAYATVNKPTKTRTGFNPLTGELVDMDTNLPVQPPPPRLGEIRKGYRYIGGEPASPKSWKKV